MKFIRLKVGDFKPKFEANKNKRLDQLVFDMLPRYDQLTEKLWVDIYPTENILIDGFQIEFIANHGLIKKVIGESLNQDEDYVIVDNELQFAVAYEK